MRREASMLIAPAIGAEESLARVGMESIETYMLSTIDIEVVYY